MASPQSPADPLSRRPQFREVALASGLVTEAQLAAAESAVRGSPAAPRPDGALAADSLHDQAVAEQLVMAGTLTAFQARELLAGKTRFRLGRYLVIDELGRGGMGQVFKAEHELMGRHVAIKVLPRAKSTPDSEAAFRREMRILGRLDHENLVRAFDAGHDAMVYYLVTELVMGIDLRRQIRKYGPLDEPTTASVFLQVARALAYAHGQGVVHRDVKPGNILVTDDGRAKVLDMGLAGSMLEAEAVRLGRIVGTMDYIAPEQIRSPDEVGPAADLYAFGCTLYFAVTGSVPFPGGTHQEKMQRHLHDQPRPVSSLAPQLSPAMARLVEELMDKSPAGRPASTEEVIDRLADWSSGPPLPPPRRTGRGGTGAWLGERSGSDSGRRGDSRRGSDPGRRDDSRRGDSASRSSWPDFAGGTFFESLAERVRTMRPAQDVGLRNVAKVIGVGVAAGVGFAFAVAAVQGLDPERFGELPVVGSLRPAAFGWAAFLFMVAVQGFAALAERRR